MRYLRHLVELYLEYMKLAFAGIFLSTIALTGYAAFTSGYLVVGLAVILLSLAVLNSVTWRQRRHSEMKAKRYLRIAQKETKVSQAVEGTMLEMENSQQVKDYLESTTVEVEDFQKAALICEMGLLLEDLKRLNVSKPIIEKSVDRFLILYHESADGRKLHSLRQRVLRSVLSDIVAGRRNKAEQAEQADQTEQTEQDRKVAG